ncbi:DUF1122 domain-containing protein [Acidianus sulfidivorans JP7]|uniref:DUF1122 domain-containing protein n=1 Tax=Acidianus sulfidivorans JP7 TaxID=619593 RepID=A0A2U9IM68_9CREN|nr:DUF1122 family protein [Acidianus sulfidivorans]AWR97128.1 DUF1122 domain-containing protein [Acidianus sulfidivorans JP7]
MLQGNINNYVIQVKNEKKTHIKELIYFELYLNDKLVGRCNYFSGRRQENYPAWLEIDYFPWLRKESVDLEVGFFKIIYNFLPYNSRLFVTYDKDKDTLELISRGFSAIDTPLGFSLLKAGFTWFKLWYFPEGGNEGGPKIQANKPLNEEIGKEELEELLQSEEIKNLEVKEWLVNYVKGKSRDNSIQ